MARCDTFEREFVFICYHFGLKRTYEFRKKFDHHYMAEFDEALSQIFHTFSSG